MRANDQHGRDAKKVRKQLRKAKEASPSMEKETVLVSPSTPQMAALYRQNEHLKRKRISFAGHPSIPDETWKILQEKKAKKKIKVAPRRKTTVTTQAL